MAAALQIVPGMSPEPDSLPYVAARIGAFIKANSLVLLCATCWRALVRSAVTVTRAAGTPGWCTRCGRAGATILGPLPLPRVRARRRRRRAPGAAPGAAA